jgi:hypothetical protein
VTVASPEDAANRFVTALASGNERAIWELFSEEARRHVIDVGEHQGMPAILAGRVRAGSASAEEMDRFLVDLVEGLRRDLEGSTLHTLRSELMETDGARARVALIEPLAVRLPSSPPGLPAAWLDLARHDDQWQIDGLELPNR